MTTWSSNCALDWPEPDLSILNDDLPEAPKLPLSSFGRVGDLISHLAEDACAPVDYAAFAMLTVSAALVGGCRKVLPDPKYSSWKEPLAIWTALIGPPSSGKTPSLVPFADALTRLERDIRLKFAPMVDKREREREVAKVHHANWKTETKKSIAQGRDLPAKPSEAHIPEKIEPPEIRIMDATIESVARSLRHSPKGILQWRDEMFAWISGMMRYSHGDDRPHWLEMFSGGAVKVDRVTREPIFVDNALASVLGGIQPDRFTELLNSADDGFIARFLPIYPQPVPRRRSRSPANRERLYLILKRLHALEFDNQTVDQNSPVDIAFCPAGADSFFEFQKRIDCECKKASGVLSGWIGKAPSMVARISATLSLLDWADSEGSQCVREVEQSYVNRAIRLWYDYLLPMATRSLTSRDFKHERIATRVFRALMDRKSDRINWRDVRRTWGIAEIKSNLEESNRALDVLINAGVLRQCGERKGPTKGRKKKDFDVNPKALNNYWRSQAISGAQP